MRKATSQPRQRFQERAGEADRTVLSPEAEKASGARRPTFDVEQAGSFLELLQPVDVLTHSECWLALVEATDLKGYPKQTHASLFEVHERLAQLNESGRAIFVCINAITPAYDEKGSAKRPAHAVTRVRAVYGDFDDPSKPLPAFELPPSIIVATSENRHHAYWLTAPNDLLPVQEFDSIQRGIIAKYGASGADKSILSPGHVMRLPGSVHWKGEPHLVRIVAAPGHRYTAAQLRAAFPAPPKRAKFNVPWDGQVPAHLEPVVHQVHEWYGPAREDGGYVVDCPWESEHTTAKNKSEAMYWPPSEANGGKGWYRCMHAHCAERFASDYHRAVWTHLRGEDA
jgi:hypothetical protein